MLPAPEKRAQGSLVAFIDLLFLLVAFFTLLLFFIQQERTVAEEELEQTQQRLEETREARAAAEQVVESLEPYMEKIAALQQAERERARREAEKAKRRARKDRVRVTYEVLADGDIRYRERVYGAEAFRREVVEPLREEHWISFRAFATPDTPFGQVVSTRRKLLEHQGEFDTYWDNLTNK